jgi:hypothetical protein
MAGETHSEWDIRAGLPCRLRASRTTISTMGISGYGTWAAADESLAGGPLERMHGGLAQYE